MPTLTPDQRNYYYILEAERTGIHKPILAALYQAYGSPTLTDGETGLGISPANRVSLDQVNTFPEQVQYAANTLRSLTDLLVSQGWKGVDLWNSEKGRYADGFVQRIASGYAPAASDTRSARLEAGDTGKLLNAYLQDIDADYKTEGLPQSLGYLDRALLSFIERLPTYYVGLAPQREALLESVRVWRGLDTRDAAIAYLLPGTTIPATGIDESKLDIPLKQFIGRISPNYSGLPQQREALIRLAQLWRELPTREAAIASLAKDTSPDTGVKIVDPALVAFVQRLLQYYQGQGTQRNAVTEAFRLWRGLASRGDAIAALGIDPNTLNASTSNPTALTNAATQLDRELLNFLRRVPSEYDETDQQREALIRLVQLWRNLPTRTAAVQSLFEDLKRMDTTNPNSPDAPPKPVPIVIPKRPDRWTTQNIQLSASIIPNGYFTWAEATHGGTRMPPNQATVDAMVRIAKMAQQARERIGRPFIVTSWYRPPAVNKAVGGASSSRHMVGDAIDFTVEGLTGSQLYWTLDPWWPGGLGRYIKFSNLCHIDARSYRARWLNP